MKKACLCAIGKARSLNGKEEGREDSPLRGPSIADHPVWHTVAGARTVVCQSGNPVENLDFSKPWTEKRVSKKECNDWICPLRHQ